ncbi:hypothetical protein BO82DRAFT_389340 [Aspergillus uvarum CBS 121591]|uniref:Uncharacterized protein n=1 Tax=Aspergillus uvarum CBS 121591 TaxID=1448315 RepID=A0A319CMU6_9EURO|nr:hypothetical protein BO82DRAFT_389340 [Aspergillus uvarum CBS 121591]PYH85709.1 hypothetical protein BO82DRAFT_389340 [Aspergillus uvarum CBS 121591]
MSYDRVIQDSDDEDDPLVGPHSPVQEYDTAHADDYLQADVKRHQEIEGNYDASMNIDFDQYLQSQERSPPGHSSPQHQQPERWIPTNSGGGSMGSMMTEIGLAQQRLFDDDEVQMVDPSRQHPREHAHVESTHAETMIPRHSEEQVSVDPTGYPYTSDPSSYSAIDSNISPAQAGLSLSSNTHPNTSSLNATPPPQQYEAPLSDLQNEYPMHTHVEVPIRPHHHDFSSIPSFDPSSAAAQTSSSFNVFEASLPPLQNVYPEDTDHHHHNNFSYSAATVPTEVAPTSSPRRVASLQATPFSPHDTQPFSPVPSAAKASRSKTENQHKSTPTSNPTQTRTAVSTPLFPTQLSTDELVAIQVPAMEIPVVEKKRGRKKKQQQQQEQQEAQSLPESHTSTTSNVIVIDDDAGDNEAAQYTTTTTTTTDIPTPSLPPPATIDTTNKPEKRKPGRPPKNPKPAPTDPPDPLNQDPPPHPTTATTTDLSPNPHNLINNSEPPSVQTTSPTAPKEPRKKKLKRGKTTSITLTKTYESDIEPDVLWIEEDAMEGNPTKPRRGPSPAVELPPPLENQSTETNSGIKANAHLESEAAAAPKKRGRKRKNPDPDPPASEQEPIRLPEHSDTVEPQKEPGNECLGIPNISQQRIQEGEEAGEEEVPPPRQADLTPDPQPAPEPVVTVPVTPLKPNKGPDKHSPISSTSKVPLRVGLSRRARIAPLLKVVKR